MIELHVKAGAVHEEPCILSLHVIDLIYVLAFPDSELAHAHLVIALLVDNAELDHLTLLGLFPL